MIQVSRTDILNELALMYDDIEPRSRKNIMQQAVEGSGKLAISFLIKKCKLQFSKEELSKEIDELAEESEITFEQLDQMKGLIKNAENGSDRVMQFLRKKKRFIIK